MTAILVVDDDRKINEFITISLERAGYHVWSALDGESGLAILSRHSIDLVVLDIMMPKFDGWEVAGYLQDLQIDLPILMLSAKGQIEDKLKGFSLGVDDYLQKPFMIEELVARVKAILSRYGVDERDTTVGNTRINLSASMLVVANRQHDLPKKERDVLAFLMKHQNHVVTREQLINNVWGLDFEGDERTVDVHIKRLRDKLAGSALTISSVRGVGYKLEVAGDE